jgi:rhodanese-related sulfurtransferase
MWPYRGMHRGRCSGYRGRVSATADLLETYRRDVVRVRPEDLAAEMAAGALVVDTRPAEQRARDGELPGALVIDRNVLEWRLDPTSPDRIAQSTPELRVIVVCNEGYSSSLAVHTLRQLGLHGATDLVGGFQAWLQLQAPALVAQPHENAGTGERT